MRKLTLLSLFLFLSFPSLSLSIYLSISLSLNSLWQITLHVGAVRKPTSLDIGHSPSYSLPSLHFFLPTNPPNHLKRGTGGCGLHLGFLKEKDPSEVRVHEETDSDTDRQTDRQTDDRDTEEEIER